jgi:hemin uptake protein HemP
MNSIKKHPPAIEINDTVHAESKLLKDCVKIYASEVLFKGDSVIIIQHGCENYRLQITRQGKLILTK